MLMIKNLSEYTNKALHLPLFVSVTVDMFCNIVNTIVFNIDLHLFAAMGTK